MKRSLSNKETKDLIEKVQGTYNLALQKKDRFEIDDNIVLVNGQAAFFYSGESLVPTLKELLKSNFLKKISVDMGAVKFVAGGADVMRPGIRKIDETIAKDDFVSIVDEIHSRPLAVGKAMFNASEMQAMASGKVVKNLNYIGDKIWLYV